MNPPRLPHTFMAAVALVAAFALPSAAHAVAPPPALLAHWSLDETTGPTVRDTVDGMVGTLQGSPLLGAQTARSDDTGAGITLSGGSAVELSGAPALPADVTLEAWIKPSASGWGARHILSRGNATTGLHLGLDANDRLVLEAGTGSGSRSTIGPVVPTATWHHVVATVAGLGTALYLDGRRVASGTLPAPPAATNRTLYVGRYSGATNYYWRGGVDEVSLHDGALDAAQVAARFAAVADVTPPAVLVSAAPPPQSAQRDAALTFTATKSGSTFTCQLDGRPRQSCAGSAAYSGLTEGDHAVAIHATDRYGIAAAGPLTVRWRVDLTAPDTLLLAARPAPGTSATVAFFSETGAGFECQVQSGPWAACTSPLRAPAGATVAVRAHDGAGHTDPTPAVAALVAPRAAPTYGNVSTSFILAGQRGGELRCRLDSGRWTACPGSLTFTGLSYGAHFLAVADSALVGVAGASIAWTAPVPAPSLITARFPLLLTFASRRAQQRTKAGRVPRLLYRANSDGTAVVNVRRGRRTVARWTTAFHRGSNSMAFPLATLRRLGAGRHVLTLAPQNSAGAGPVLTRRFDVVRLRGR